MLFSNAKVLPKFDLITYKAVQSIGGSTEFDNWFEALEKWNKTSQKLSLMCVY